MENIALRFFCIKKRNKNSFKKKTKEIKDGDFKHRFISDLIFVQLQDNEEEHIYKSITDTLDKLMTLH